MLVCLCLYFSVVFYDFMYYARTGGFVQFLRTIIQLTTTFRTFLKFWRRTHWKPAVSERCRRVGRPNGPVLRSSVLSNPARVVRWRIPPLAGSHRYALVTVIPQLIILFEFESWLLYRNSYGSIAAEMVYVWFF